MSDLGEKVKTSIERLKSFAPRNGEGYYLAFSGGKDSVVCKALLEMSGMKYDAHYANTSVDPPELVRFIMDVHPDVKREWQTYPDTYKKPELAGKRITMWNLIPERGMPPTRIVRHCCRHLKEPGGDGRFTVTGVRWAESAKRKENHGVVSIFDRKASGRFDGDENFRPNRSGGVVLVNDNEESRRTIERCYQRMKTTVNPIIDWTDDDVWDFIRAENIPVCSLYREGFQRVGCIGCPMSGQHGREAQFARWPGYKKLYLKAFGEMIKERERLGKKNEMGTTPEEVFDWWMEYDILPGQVTMDEMIGEA